MTRRGRFTPRFGRWRGLPLVALTVVVLAMRLLTPAAPSDPGQGYIPICSGAGVVYVYIGDGAPPTGEAPQISEPCEQFGLGHAVPAPAAPALLAPRRIAEAARPAPALRLHASPVAGFNPRAPPTLA